MKAEIIVSDPGWNFSDPLKNKKNIKRSAIDNYKSVLSLKDIEDLKVKDIAADNAVLALWCPSSLLQTGLNCMKNYGFRHTQTWIWVKTKKNPLGKLFSSLKKMKREVLDLSVMINSVDYDDYHKVLEEFNINDILNFFMGRVFRQTHEVCLIGVRGKKIYKHLKNKSQVSVFLSPAKKKHSEKPEELQDKLELMFPDFKNKVELFARRERDGWITAGNELPQTNQLSGDIRDSIEIIKNMP